MSTGVYRTPVFPPFRASGLRFVPTKNAPGTIFTIPRGKIELRPEGIISWAEPTIFTIPQGVMELRGSADAVWAGGIDISMHRAPSIVYSSLIRLGYSAEMAGKVRDRISV